MAETKFTFEINMGTILAKMHLGGCQRHADFNFFNTGITDNEKTVPENINEKSKINFDFSNKKGIYEIGVALPSFEVQLKSDAKQLNEDTVSDAKAKVDSQSGIMDSAEEIDRKKEKAAAAAEADQKQQTDDQKEKTQPADKDGKETASQEKTLPADILNANWPEIQKQIEAQKKNAVEYLQHYMKVFGGQENAIKITDKTTAVTFLPLDSADPYKIKYTDWKIPKMEPEEIQKYLLQQLADEKTKVLKLGNICFKTGYSLKTVIKK